MFRHTLFLFLFLGSLYTHAQELLTRFESSAGNETFSYQEGIRFCESLDSLSDFIKLETYGMSNAGYPLHLLILDNDGLFTPQEGKKILLINNAIHPGEPDGVEASLALARDYALDIKMRKKYANTTILIIPFYNIGGVLNRNSHTRTNQDGPAEYGFRGSSIYLDLNRDFIKADAGETFAFYKIFHRWNPHVFIDTHVSNGADYQYTMTLIHSQEEKYDPFLARHIEERFIPALYLNMKKRGQEMAPYVNVHGDVPDSGIHVFFETPRFSNGYVSLFDCIALVAETHMLKPYKDRVKATRLLLEALLEEMEAHDPRPHIAADKAGRAKNIAGGSYHFPVSWKESPLKDSILFKGYEATHKTSAISGRKRLWYNREKPYSRYIPYYQEFEPATVARLPYAYIIPQGWEKVITRLEAQGVTLKRLKNDTLVRVGYYRVIDYKTSPNPYEGHYPHSGVKVDTFYENILFYKNDILIIPDAKNARLLQNTLEPVSPDSYFNWNFFDAVLQQKEWFSDYVFEDMAEDYLLQNDSLKMAFETKKQMDTAFAADAFAQLYYIYRHTPHYEKGHRRIPVYFITGKD